MAQYGDLPWRELIGKLDGSHRERRRRTALGRSDDETHRVPIRTVIGQEADARYTRPQERGDERSEPFRRERRHSIGSGGPPTRIDHHRDAWIDGILHTRLDDTRQIVGEPTHCTAVVGGEVSALRRTRMDHADVPTGAHERRREPIVVAGRVQHLAIVPALTEVHGSVVAVDAQGAPLGLDEAEQVGIHHPEPKMFGHLRRVPVVGDDDVFVAFAVPADDLHGVGAQQRLECVTEFVDGGTALHPVADARDPGFQTQGSWRHHTPSLPAEWRWPTEST